MDPSVLSVMSEDMANAMVKQFINSPKCPCCNEGEYENFEDGSD